MQIKELGHVVLYVTNSDKVGDFYRDILGFHEIKRAPGMVLFSSGRTHHELMLLEVGGQPKEYPVISPGPGLYHIGFKVGDGAAALQAVYQELLQKGVRVVGSADHTVTHSLYILDPDGNELELYTDVSDEWKINPEVILNPVKQLYL